MAAFNRNVITSADVANLGAGKIPATFDKAPPAGAVLTAAASGGETPPPEPGGETPGGETPPPVPGGVTVPTADDFLTKLLKYVPAEVLGMYLFIEGVIETNVTQSRMLAWWLAGLLILSLVTVVVYNRRVLAVKRKAQIAMSIVGLAVYVFSVGGWFATTTWYESWYPSIALPIFAVLVGIVRLKPLPTAG